MAAPTRLPATGDRANRPADERPPSALATANAVALPVAADSLGQVAVLPRRSFAAGPSQSERRWRIPFRLLTFFIVVVVPSAMAAAYFFFIAADQYVAEFRFALRAADPVRAEVSGLFQGSIAPSPIGVDSYAVVQYVDSRDILDDLGKTLDLREMFSRPEADWLARLALPVSIEELVRYWKTQVDAFFDVTNGTIVVRARAFTADDALKLSQARGWPSSATARASSTRARPPMPPRRWPAEYATRSFAPTRNWPPSSITCAPTRHRSKCSRLASSHCTPNSARSRAK